MERTFRLICSDLDGTLLNDEKTVSDRNKDAMRKCKEGNIPFAIVSGRPVGPILRLLKQWGIEQLVSYVIGMNGGVLYDCKKAKKTTFHMLDGVIIQEIMSHFQSLPVRFIIFENDIRYVSYSDEKTRKQARFYQEEEIQKDLYRLCEKPQHKLIIQCRQKDMATVEAHAKTYQNTNCVCFKSAPDLFEYVHPAVNKSFGVSRLCEYMGISMHVETIVLLQRKTM